MKKLSLLIFSLLAISFIFQSCDNSKTYAEMLEEEREAIKTFISRKNIQVIGVDQFIAQDSMTYDNQYVLFEDNGVYMHIENKGEGRKVENNDEIITRCVEVKVATGDTTVNTMNLTKPDIFRYTVTSTSMYGQFIDDNGYYVSGGMAAVYGSQVPSGWLVPLSYIKPGKTASTRSRVQLIVPSKMGQQEASQYVYACFYDITYQLPL